MLLKTEAELEHITDLGMITWLESGVRGGVSYSNMRHAEADDTHRLVYLDVNNLVSIKVFLKKKILLT